MRMKIIFVAALLLSSCGSTHGQKVDEAKLASMKKGSTTISEAINILGAPTQRSTLEDGRTMLTYYYINTEVRPETLVPVVGMFVGGADSKTSYSTLWFDKKGVFTGSSYSEGGSKMNTGVLNRSSQ